MKRTTKNISVVLIVIISLLLFTNCREEKDSIEKPVGPNTLTKAEVADGWQLLFDGKSFDGWRGIGTTEVPKGHWKIVDGQIQKIASGDVPTKADGQPVKGGDLITKKTFKNFELKFEWKISEGGNSGVKYNVDESISIENGWTGALGYEYQVLDDDKHSDNLNPTHRSASLYDMIESKGKTLNPVGEYNSAKIVFNNNILEHWLNGKKVVEINTDTPEFEELFKKSKYHNHPKFTVHKDAHIVLQDHGNDCWYRNIKIKILK
jgi:hypothetical protein